MFRADNRAQSIQIGAVLLFATLIVSFSAYQAFVVPEQNRRIEYTHQQAVEGQLVDLRNTIVSAAGDAAGRAISVDLGTGYPARAVAVNPGPASGSLRTVHTTSAAVNVSVVNATALDGDAAAVWNGTARNYSTGGLVYRPDYNVYQNAPVTVYSSTVLAQRHRDDTLTRTDQTLVRDDQITVVALNGSLAANSAGTVSVPVQPTSANANTVPITNTTEESNVTLRVPTSLSEATWKSLLEDQRVSAGGHVRSVATQPHPVDGLQTLVVHLEAGVTYDLQLARVTVGDTTPDRRAAYLTRVAGNDSTVPEDGTTTLTVEVRDRYDNPLSGVRVNASASDGRVTPAKARTDEDGRLSLTYHAPADIDGAPVPETVNVSLDTDPAVTGDVDASTPENVTFHVTVRNTDRSGLGGGGGGGGGFSISWRAPTNDNPSAPFSDCSGTDCTFDVRQDGDDAFTLTATTTPELDGVRTNLAVNNSTVATVAPRGITTGVDGTVSTTVTASDNGVVSVLANTNGGTARINLTVVGFVDGNPIVFVQSGTLSTIVNSTAPVTYDGSGVAFLGPRDTDIDSDGTVELLFVNDTGTGAGDIYHTDATGDTARLADDATITSNAGQTRIAPGVWEGNPLSVYFVGIGGRNGEEIIQRVAPSGTPTPVEEKPGNPGQPKYFEATAIAGVADVDGDGEDELVYGKGGSSLRYLQEKQNGNREYQTFGVGYGVNNGPGLGSPADFDGDGTARVPIVDGSNNLALVATDGTKTILVQDDNPTATPAKTSVATVDVDDDGHLELVFVDSLNGDIMKYVDDDTDPIGDGDGVTVKTIRDDTGATVSADPTIGLA